MVFHSDRGIQYASEEFRSQIKGKVVQSMSRKGNCWDNAVAESFFRSLKCEMIYGNKILSDQKMELEIFEYIEIWGVYEVIFSEKPQPGEYCFVFTEMGGSGGFLPIFDFLIK